MAYRSVLVAMIMMSLILLTLPALCVERESAVVGPDDGWARLIEIARLSKEIRAALPKDALYLDGSPDRVNPVIAEEAIRAMQPVIAAYRNLLDQRIAPAAVDSPIASNHLADHSIVLRDLASAVRMDVAWRAHRGERDRVAADLTGLVRLSMLSPSDGTLQGAVAGMAQLAATSQLLRTGAIDGGLLSSDESSSLLDVFDSAARAGVLGVAEAMSSERARTLEWMDRLSADEASRSDMLRTLAETRLADGDVATAARLMELPADAVAGGVVMYDAAMTRLIEATRLDDPDAAGAAFRSALDDIESGRYGAIAQGACVRANIVDMYLTMMDEIDATRALLRESARHPDGARGVRNAAVLYRRAMALRNRLDEATWDSIQLADAAPDLLREGAIRFPFDAVSEILELLLEASTLERCSFVARHERMRDGLWPSRDFVPGMGDLATLARGAVMARCVDGSLPEHPRWLCPLDMMVSHLSQEGILEASFLARDMASRNEDLLVFVAERWPALVKPGTARIANSKAHAQADRFGFRRATLDYATMVGELLTERAAPANLRAKLERLALRLEQSGDTHFHGDPAALATEIKVLDDEMLASAFGRLDDLVRDVSQLARLPMIPETLHGFTEDVDRDLAENEDLIRIVHWAEVLLEPMKSGLIALAASTEEAISPGLGDY